MNTKRLDPKQPLFTAKTVPDVSSAGDTPIAFYVMMGAMVLAFILFLGVLLFSL